MATSDTIPDDVASQESTEVCGAPERTPMIHRRNVGVLLDYLTRTKFARDVAAEEPQPPAGYRGEHDVREAVRAWYVETGTGIDEGVPAPAASSLGTLTLSGAGEVAADVEQDQREAAAWLRKASQGSAVQVRLGAEWVDATLVGPLFRGGARAGRASRMTEVAVRLADLHASTQGHPGRRYVGTVVPFYRVRLAAPTMSEGALRASVGSWRPGPTK